MPNPLLTLNVRGQSYLGLTRSISWLLMPWLLTWPGHQQPWYWLYRICRSFSYWGRILSKCVIAMWRSFSYWGRILSKCVIAMWRSFSYWGRILSKCVIAMWRSFCYWGRILSKCVIAMWRNDTKCKHMFMFPLKNLARKGLSREWRCSWSNVDRWCVLFPASFWKLPGRVQF